MPRYTYSHENQEERADPSSEQKEMEGSALSSLILTSCSEVQTLWSLIIFIKKLPAEFIKAEHAKTNGNQFNKVRKYHTLRCSTICQIRRSYMVLNYVI